MVARSRPLRRSCQVGACAFKSIALILMGLTIFAAPLESSLIDAWNVRAFLAPAATANTQTKCTRARIQTCQRHAAQQRSGSNEAAEGSKLEISSATRDVLSLALQEFENLRSSKIRQIVAGFFAVLIALALNLGGFTELLLGVVPGGQELAQKWHLDTIYAVNGFKAYYAKEYRVQYPQGWVSISDRDAEQFAQNPGVTAQGWVLDSAWSSSANSRQSMSKRQAITVEQQLVSSRAGANLEEFVGSPRQALQRFLDERPETKGSDTRSSYPLRAERVKVAGVDYYRFQWRTEFQSPSTTAGFSQSGYGSLALGVPDSQGRRAFYTCRYVTPEKDDTKRYGPAIIEGFKISTDV